MCKAIGREIRYVEYKLRRQQQEKKKKKQSRQDWLNGVNSEPQESVGTKKSLFHKAHLYDFSTHYLKHSIQVQIREHL